MRIEHEPHEASPAPSRRLCCSKCGHGFTVTEGAQALERKRRLDVGLPADPDETQKAFRESAKAVAKVWPL